MNTIGRAGSACAILFIALGFGNIAYASANPVISSQLQTVYVGHNISAGKFSANLTGLDTIISGGNYVYPAAINVYYGGLLTNVTQIMPGTTIKFTVNGKNLFVNMSATHYSNSTNQSYATIVTCFASPSNQTVKPDCSKPKDVYVGASASHGKFTVNVTQISKEEINPTSETAYAYFSIYYNNKFKQNASVSLDFLHSSPYNTTELVVNGHTLFITTTQIFDGLYADQKWATVQLSESSKTPAENTVYVGHNSTCSKFTLELQDLGQPNSQGVSDAYVSLYYKGNLTNVTQIPPKTLQTFEVNGKYLDVYVNQTFAGLYAYQKWASVQLFCK